MRSPWTGWVPGQGRALPLPVLCHYVRVEDAGQFLGGASMTFNPDIHHRRSIRLRGYDYASAGAYFVTICAQDRACLFGQVVDGEMRLNEAGRMVEREWLSLADRFPAVQLDEYEVMPNHFHGIIVLNPVVGATLAVALDGVGTGRAVGATLEVALDGVGAGAGASPAPTGAAMPMPTVGNTLAVALDGVGAGAGASPAPTDGVTSRAGITLAPTLGAVVGTFKSIATRAYTDGVRQCGWLPVTGRLWQRNYYEHVIRSERSLDRLRQYVVGNPSRWDLDRENPSNVYARTLSGRILHSQET